jgi:hypothetical protein
MTTSNNEKQLRLSERRANVGLRACKIWVSEEIVEAVEKLYPEHNRLISLTLALSQLSEIKLTPQQEDVLGLNRVK